MLIHLAFSLSLGQSDITLTEAPKVQRMGIFTGNLSSSSKLAGGGT